jgi:hypothetical protein
MESHCGQISKCGVNWNIFINFIFVIRLFFYSKSIIHLLFINNRIHVIFFMILLIQWFICLETLCRSFEFKSKELKIKNKELNTSKFDHKIPIICYFVCCFH